MSLTPKQQRFADEYLIDGNGTRAAIAAGYSEKTANMIASENLTKPYIKEYIKSKQKETTHKLELTKEWVLNRFKEIGDLAKESGDYNASNKSTEMIGKLLGHFEIDNKQKSNIIQVGYKNDDEE